VEPGSQTNGYGARSNTEGQHNTAEGQADGPGTERRRRASGDDTPGTGPGEGTQQRFGAAGGTSRHRQGTTNGLRHGRRTKPGSNEERESTSVQKRGTVGRCQTANADYILQRGKRGLIRTTGKASTFPIFFWCYAVTTVVTVLRTSTRLPSRRIFTIQAGIPMLDCGDDAAQLPDPRQFAIPGQEPVEHGALAFAR